MSSSKLNGSVQVLAQALSDVVSESIDVAANRIKDDIKKDMNEKFAQVGRVEKKLDEIEKHFSETLSVINVAVGKIQKAAARIEKPRRAVHRSNAT